MVRLKGIDGGMKGKLMTKLKRIDGESMEESKGMDKRIEENGGRIQRN